MELRIEPYQLAEKPVFNYAELKAAVEEKMAVYAAAIYSDDQIKQAKADKAALNKLRKALNDERIKREREYMQPFMEFKGQINEIISTIDKPIKAIDQQVKDFDERRRLEKRDQIFAYWESTGAPEWLHTYKVEWLNASYSMKTIHAEIAANIEQANKDLAAIRKLPAYAFEAEEYYKGTQSLAEAVEEAEKLRERAERKAAHDAENMRHETVAAPPRPAQDDVLPKQWLSFKALLSVDDAVALREFFDARQITFEAV